MALKDNTVYDCSVIDVSKIHNEAGNISVAENGENIPFNVKRVYYLYDVPSGEARGGHAHYELEQFIMHKRHIKKIKYLIIKQIKSHVFRTFHAYLSQV